MRIAITGASGFLGRAIVKRLHDDPMVEKVVVLSRDEHKVRALADQYPEPNRLRWYVGDVRDRARLSHAFRGLDAVIHAAALKRVDAVVNDSLELQKTNVDGTVNVLQAAAEQGVRKVILVSSDKAVMPMNAYGCTKQLAEWHTVGFNAYSHPKGTWCAAVRYGNVLGSTGSVLHIWKQAIRDGKRMPLTAYEMTRFHITVKQAVQFVLTSLMQMRGGEIFVPKLDGYSLPHLGRALMLAMHPDLQRKELINDLGWFDCNGLRPGGEKLAERLLSDEELSRTHDLGDRYLVKPSTRTWSADPYPGKPLAVDAPTDSASCRHLTVDELVPIIKEEMGL